jgi:phosphopantetheine adenylyltransferase
VRLTLKFIGKFKSVAIIIKEDFTEDQRKRLCERIVNAFKNIDAEDLEKLVEFIKSNQEFQTIVLKIVREFFQFDMEMKIVD